MNGETMTQQPSISNALTVIHNRKSVRNFTGESITQTELEILLKAAMAAPSAVNCQPWEFIVVTNRKTLDALADALPFAKMLYKAGAAIIVCGVPAKAHKNFVEYAIIDSTLASQNILLTAEAIGLGAIWTAAYPYTDRMESVRLILNIPRDVIPLNVIPREKICQRINSNRRRFIGKSGKRNMRRRMRKLEGNHIVISIAFFFSNYFSS
jgi:nitroreductase